MPDLDPAAVQVLLLEMQPAIVASSGTLAPALLGRATTTLRRLCTALSVPLTVSLVPLGADPPQVIDELPGIEPIARGAVSAFDDDAVRARLSGKARTVLAVGGVSCEIAVLHTVRSAIRAGYAVHVLLDACGGLSERSEAPPIRQMESAGAIPSNISSFFTAMMSGMSLGSGPSVMAALADHWSWDVPAAGP